jgi:hypothetical protein
MCNAEVQIKSKGVVTILSESHFVSQNISALDQRWVQSSMDDSVARHTNYKLKWSLAALISPLSRVADSPFCTMARQWTLAVCLAPRNDYVVQY